MVPDRLLIHTVTLLRPSVVSDAYGNDVDGAVTSRSLRCWLDQNRHEERFEDGRTPDTEDWLMVANDSDVRVGDRVVWPGRGVEFTVHGEPAVQYTARGSHHIEATLRKVDG